jgi:hypothetical protein
LELCQGVATPEDVRVEGNLAGLPEAALVTRLPHLVYLEHAV